jgi:hypothetical protein
MTPGGCGDAPGDLPVRRAGDVAVGLALFGFVVVCLVGLPLFADGSVYLFSVATESSPIVPNQRLAATLPQLPAAAAFALGADLPLGRLIFSAGYVAIPVASLLASWWLLRRRAPALLLFVLLSFLALQLNFSGVSELLSALYLTWPLVPAMLLLPGRRWVMAYGLAVGPLLLLLHPLAFLPCFGLALLALLVGDDDAGLTRTWRRIGLWLVGNGLLRLLWTAVGLNEYERGRLNTSSALNYLLTETLAQHLLVAAVLIAVLLAAGALAMKSEVSSGASRRTRLPTTASAAALVVSVWVGAELVLGYGVALKSAVTFGIGLLAMTVVAWLVMTRRVPTQEATGPPTAMPILLCGVAILVLLLAKSTAWWTATRSLQNIVASSEAPCIRFDQDEPYALQWPWMNIVDDWAVPFTALAVRPFVSDPTGRRWQPVALLLKGDRCDLLRRTGEVRFTGWSSKPFEEVDRAFGPLRRP